MCVHGSRGTRQEPMGIIPIAAENERHENWKIIRPKGNKKKPDKVQTAFEKSMKNSSILVISGNSITNLDMQMKELFRGCKFKSEEEEQQMIDLLCHATICFEAVQPRARNTDL